MFEDSTFESNGRIHTRSRFWMVATLILNGSILVALILIPLIYPEALPRQALAFLMTAPQTPAPPQPPTRQTAQPTRSVSEIQGTRIMAPPRIPTHIFIPSGREPAAIDNVANWNPDGGDGGNTSKIFQGPSVRPVVRAEAKGPMRVSSGVVEAMALRKTSPVYPAMARAAGIQGTVTLQATIATDGTIENLRVAGGPLMLQQAAIDAVKSWRYRPYLLDGAPVEMETTVNVIFSLGR
jgi:protein TonB